MPTVFSGVVDTEDILAAEKVVDMDNEIKMLDIDTTQFTTMLMELASRQATRERVDWLEDEYFPRLVTLSASAASAVSGTTGTLAFSAGDGSVLRVGDLVRNQVSGEAFRVTAIASDTGVTVRRGIGGVAAATSASGAQCLIMGNAQAQGADIGEGKITLRVNQFNYQQIFRHSWKFTNTQTKIELWGGREPNKERAKKLVEHKRALEYSLFWGARSFDTTTGTEPIGTMGGCFEYIQTYRKSGNGLGPKASTFDKWMIDGLQHGSKNKVFFCSPVLAWAISQFPASQYRTNQTGAQTYGIKVDGFVSGAYGWDVPIVVKRDWNDFTIPASATQYGFGGVGFLIDMDRVRLRPLRERSTKLYTDRQGPGVDSTWEEYLTETSFQFEVEKSHMYVFACGSTLEP